MSNLALTLSIAFVLFSVAVAFLAIGWLITGKSRLRPGSCGRNPQMRRSDACEKEGSCALCEKNEDKRNADED